MFRRVEQKHFHIDDPGNLIGRLHINRHAAVALFFQARDRLFIRQIVRQRESVHPRRHAIFRGFVAQLDDLLDHLAFRLLQRTFLFADFYQRLQFLIAQTRARAQMQWRQKIDNECADVFQSATGAIEQRHRRFQCESADCGEPIGS